MRLSTRPNPGADREKAKPVRQAARAIDRSQVCANDTQAKVDLLGESEGADAYLELHQEDPLLPACHLRILATGRLLERLVERAWLFHGQLLGLDALTDACAAFTSGRACARRSSRAQITPSRAPTRSAGGSSATMYIVRSSLS